MSLAFRNLVLLEAKARGAGRGSRGGFAVSPMPGQAPVRATRARRDGTVAVQGGTLSHRRGDMITRYGDGSRGVVRGDIFKDTYRKVGRGKYAKNPDVTLRATIAKRNQTVRTLEGPVKARRGDVIMTGTRGERWSMGYDKFKTRYRTHF